jgi:UDP-3-O-[3-hydroxymyristoyl] glucosamine N-acyltransferase
MSAGTSFSLGRLAQALDASLDGDPERVVTGVAPLASAGPDDLSYVADRRHLAGARASRAGAYLAASDVSGLPAPTLHCRDPRRAFALALGLFHPPAALVSGVDTSARVAAGARIDPTASVGPLAIVEAGASVGPRVRIGPLVYIGADVTIGEDSVLHPHVTVYAGCRLGRRLIVHAGAVIGADGHLKIPQVGVVVVEDDVEIGANTTIDRATLGETIIGRGTKLDNLVHVGHNVEVGRGCLMAAQVGISGSCRLGNTVMLGGQVGLADHVDIGDAVTIGGGSAVVQDVPAGQNLAGSFARPATLHHRIWVAQARLPDLLRSVKALERRLAALEARTTGDS